MRKILTMMAAVASAIGLYAADDGKLSGTSFEGFVAETDLDISSSTGELIENTSGYWVTNGTDTLKIKSGISVPAADRSNRSPAFWGLDNETYLSIKTESVTNSISRCITTDGTGVSIDGGTDATKGLYFDSYVRFTAFDGDPQVNLGDNGKLAIWLKEEGEAEEGTLKTNLVITAGYLDTSLQDRAVVTNYNCAVVRGVTFNDGGWHRVTVKALDTIYASGRATPGFIVFIDGNYVYCTDETDMGIAGNLTGTAGFWNELNALFPSAHPAAADFDTITAVDFAGQGDVDELVFTRNAPFDAAKDVGLFKIQVGEGVAKVTFTTNGVSEEITANKSLTLTDDLKENGIEITATYENGYVKGTWEGLTPYSGNLFKPDADGQYVKVVAKEAGATVNGVGYETLEAAIAYVNDTSKCPAGSGTYTIALAVNVSDCSISFTNSGITNILDLAGKTITGSSGVNVITVESGAALTIVDSDVNNGGTVTAVGAANVVKMTGKGTQLVITGGTYNGPFSLRTGAELEAGSYSYADNTENNEFKLANYLADGKGAEHVGGYWVVDDASTYTIKFVYGENGATTNTQSVASGSMPTVPTPQEVAVEGKTFTGWDSTVVAAAADATYTAQYTVNSYTITFVYGLTGQSQYQQSYNYGLVPEIPGDAAITGYDLSWSPAIEAVKSNTTYTAEYTAVDYTITYMYGENELTGLTPAAYTIEDAVTLPSEVNLGVTGVAFEAWTNAEGQVVANWAAGAIGNKTFYAQVTVPGPAEKYEPGEEGITPPTGKTAAEFATAINANKAAYIDTPSTSDVAGTTAYLALFEAVADTEKGTVSIGLTTEAAADAKDAADDTAADIVSDLTATTVTIDAEPGLWYSISVSSTLGGLATGEGTRVMATDSSLSEGKLTLNIPVIDDSTPARFYKVNVNLADKPVTP